MTFITAEIGVNWDGDLILLKKMMENSKDIGCNAVKFQSFNEDIVKNHPERKRLLKSSISQSNIEEVEKIAKDTGIEWYSTPMYLDAIELLIPYVSRFKMREKDGNQIISGETSELFEKLILTGKELIISIQTSPKKSKYFNNSNIKWLYCIPKYPCSLEDLDYTNLSDFDGYSNHCQNFIAPLTAAILGSKFIEVHVTSDKSKNFIDNNVSFDFQELKKLVDLIRSSEKIKR